MASRERNGLLHARPGLRSGLLVVLVALLSCGVVVMHSLGAGHSGMGQTPGHDLGPTMSAQPVADMTSNANLEDHESGPAPAASMSYAVQGCETCAVEAAYGSDQTTDHGGMAMCLAVLSLLVWVVL
ncbi:MAG: hypothetical protein M3Y04_06495, partial [Actinomycetota bacterium]|nr:hypothetical protein [Actinomycetota bacterium]